MEKSGFFNSTSGDRMYDASDFAGYFSKLVSNGIFYANADNLRVTPGGGLSVNVLAGNAWINGYAFPARTFTDSPPPGVTRRLSALA